MIDCLFGICMLEQSTLILIIVGSAIGGLILGLLIGLAAKSGGSKEVRYIEKKD